jgi:16S rRNA (guanine966-N2)-methyltransferase
MRIIAGRFKGRKLVAFSADHIRPTTDRVKESVFNKLQGEVEGARVLDLYSGTGNLSIEAVSRGAREVVAVESNRRSVEIIRANLRSLEIDREIRVVQEDVFRFLKRDFPEPFDLVLVDPPFTKALADQTMRALAESAALAPGGTLVLELSSREPLEPSYTGLVCEDDRDYGDKRVTFWRRSP